MTEQLPSGSKVLVTGATGFTGSVLVRKLVEQNLKVVAIARLTSNLAPFKGMPIQWLQGDVFDPELIDKATEGVNYIFHMVTPFRDPKLKDEGYRQVHVISTQLLAKAALKQPDFKRFVHVSTIGVHSHIEHPPADENYRMKPGDIYQETKMEGELWIREFAKKEGLSLAVVRPAGIYGPGDKRLLKIFQMVSRRWVPVVGDGSNLYHFIHVDDLTDFFLVAAMHPQAEQEVFICGSPGDMTFKRMVDLIGECYQVDPKLIQIPATPLFAIGDLCEFICKPLGIQPPIYRRRIAFYTKDRSFNTTKMRNMLGFKTAHSDEAGLQETAQWYVDRGWVSLKKS
ncbi:NAD-dependent epimerase/dehydratase family protein [Oscillatoriales cyanobacterium LEGE 11467]|uniref:NAD-dependent epimerase/dehydratase family protein n=1 Tax=Zarconia navalis LEGE 11467 TaxID=1828826 RepID=A0A928Z978_9CYAN|nr:NAD-dependent epimerase/dehydratase family protein [Zarconia navalis]MBE9040511.1 NAD-dependent epimerase/dehydratase family protein [Zarconia navalis LEGE 11467]